MVVHSLYLDDPENPRNVKTYDSTNQATITDILIDNVLPGDEIGLKQQTMTGTYATAQAGETLTADGKTQKDRLKKLKENVITASTKAELTGNDFGDYFIEKESYSGAICREVLEVRIKNQVKLYGEADIETPWHINSFDANSTSNPKGWLSITGLKGTDKIELKDSFFKLGAFAPDNSTIAFGKQTPVGRYPVTETGITEANLPVLNSDPHMGTTYYMYLAPDIVATNPPDMGVSGPSTDALILLAVAVGCAYLCVSAYAHGGKRYAKDDDGKKRIERYTQLCTLILAVVMAVGYYFIARNYGAVKYTAGFAGVLCGVIVVSVFAAGAMTVQWLGTLIDARGIGSGLSMLIFAGIVSRWSGTVSVIRQIAERVAAGQWGYMAVGVFLLAFMLASLLYAVCLNAAEKRIPVQYAGKNGNRGAGSFIPVRLVTGGVMPVIFAGSVLGIPSMISLFVSGEKHPSLYRALTAFARGNWLYILLYAVLIFAFHRFYLAIQFDSTEIATNLRKRGGMIPGVRPGKPTADYLNRAIKGMADSGSLALVLVACLPMLLSKAFGISLQLGGTSLLIVVGVAIELAGQVDSQLTIRHHDGFLD